MPNDPKSTDRELAFNRVCKSIQNKSGQMVANAISATTGMPTDVNQIPRFLDTASISQLGRLYSNLIKVDAQNATTESRRPDTHQEEWNDEMFDLIAYAQDNLTRAYAAVGNEGCAVLEGLIGAQRRIVQAIEHYYNKE